MRQIDVALIGHGYWGKVLKKYLIPKNGFKLVHICDSKSNLDSIWSDIEAVVVATPIETHYSIVKEALIHGKHILSEKPLALKAIQCRELKQLAQKRKLSLLVEYTQSFSPSLLLATKIDIGPIQAIDMQVKHLGRFNQHDVYWLLASHCLSILDLFVPLKTLSFTRVDFIKTLKRTETGSVLFKNQHLEGQITLSLNYPGKVYQVVIYGSKGTIIYDTQTKPALRVVWYDKKYNLLAPELVTRKRDYDFDEANNVQHAVMNFYKAITSKQATNIDLATEATRVLEELENNK